MQSLYETKHGCRISFSLQGTNTKKVLVAQHGMIASIKDSALFDPLLRENISVLLIARPGYGDSDCYQLRNVAEYSEIVEEILDHLHIARVSVLGSSSGAPYALSLAHRLPDRIDQTFVFSGIPLLTDPQIASLWPYPIEQGRSVEYFQDVSNSIFSWIDDDSSVDRQDLLDSKAHNFYGPALDLKIRGEDWGFSLGDIKGEVIFEHSLDDQEIAYEAARLTALKIPKAHLIQRTQGGHFTVDLFQEFLKLQVIKSMKERRAG